MADFVAVIRRTVDGLSDNVPEMRAKVYDKARGAVRRQLESMKPQPSEEMINRQMAKLELAIAEVESDNAEALPPVEEPIAAEEPAYEQPVAVEEPQVVAHPQAVEAQDEPADVEPAAEEQVDTATMAEPVREEASVEPEAAADSEPENWPSDPAAADVVASVEPEGTEEHAADLHSDPIWEAAEPAAVPEVDTTSETVAEDESAVEVEPPEAEHVDIDHAQTHEQEQAEVEHTEADHHHDDAPAAVPAWGHAALEIEPEPAPAAIASEWELPEWNDSAPAAAEAGSVWVEREQPVEYAEEAVEVAVERVAERARETDGETLAASVEPTHSWAWEDADPFAQSAAPAADVSVEPTVSDWSWPVEKSAAVEAGDERPVTGQSKSSSWDDIDDLLNGDGSVSVAAATADLAPARVADPQPVDEMAAPSRPISYRVEPKRSAVNVKTIGLAAVLLLLLGGGGFAYWQNQNSVNSWVSGMLASATAPAPAENTVDASGSGTAETTPAADTATPVGQEVAALNTAAPTKFTQRLQVDGSEVDEGPAVAAAGESAEQEGKSVAAQTEAGQPADTAASAQTTPTTTTTTEAQPAENTTPATDTVQPQAVPAGAQKMFLYEERLGQSAPTAIEGNVAWSVKEESPGGDAKPEPVIQAQINVPERGLTALVTIKRNADASLPASHVIEFVFSLPETFEGGSIDSVQRVSMKRNEQDRGDALIAVPAKITEDFHMIALNDFPEAVATNTELLRSRGWIDIPLTYRNGRRALLTLEKGATGTEAFNKALQAWSLTATASPAAAQ